MTRIKGFYIYALAVICLLASIAAAEELTLNINVKKPIAVVSEKFLSITLDPIALFNTDLLSDVEKSTNMARALAPAYVRIGGPRSNLYVFERGLYPQETHHDPGLTFTETHWINLHQWAERSGLNIVACIAPQMSEGARAWDPRNALDLISFSDHMGYNTSWQLGYECQTNCKTSGTDLGRDVTRLRSMLDAFPRFAEAGLIAGPDVVTWKSKQEQQYLQEYFSAAAAGLSALTWHPDFAGVSLENDGVSMHYDNLASEKDSLYKVIGRQVAKKPLWLAESKPEDCKRNFLGALVWARRLGNSAKLGAQVLMRQPDNLNFLRPTPDFWVSILHKMLVGREVLDTKISSGNRTHIHFYAQCTKPSPKYEKGSVTIFGLNLTPTKASASLKGLKIKNVHKYVLLPGYDSPNRMFAETVLLNNDLLSLVNGKEIPEINPIIYNADRDIKLKLPSGGIGFWVIPGLKVKSCLSPEDDITDRNVIRKANKRLEELDVEEDLEPDDDSSREMPDVADSFEDRRSLLRHQLQRRLIPRRSVRHKDIDRDDERNLRRGEGIKRDVRKHEKSGRKKENYDDDESEAHTTSDEKDENFEEAIEQKILNGQSLDSGEEIRAKLVEYKRRLIDHEYRKKQRGKATALTKECSRDETDGVSNKNMDTGKVIEALTLITKVENAMKDLEKNNDTQQKMPLSPMLVSDNFSDVTSELKQGSNNDELLDEVLNTEKAKRTAIPTQIEDQLKALYRLLSEEKDKKNGLSSLRHRRDLDKRVGDDPLGLRRDSIFLRRRTDAKERRNERRQRLRERIEEYRRERETTKKIQRDGSGENNFYGFQYRAPIKNFPEGDLYLQGTAPADEQRNAPTKSMRAVDEHPDVWLEESDGNHMPNEFYENIKRPGYDAKENLKEYGELWEAEALHKDDDTEKNIHGAVEYEIVTERQLTEAEDRKAKEKAVQQLINYYETAPQEQSYDFEEMRQNHMQGQQQQLPQVQPLQLLPQIPQQPQPQIYYQQQPPVNYQQALTARNNLQQGSYYYSNQYPQQNRRSKRDISELENLLDQEMIDEDDNNLRDCQCRVIRGTENCKDCQIQTERPQVGTPLFIPGQIPQYPTVPLIGQRIRMRRNTEEVAIPAIDLEQGVVAIPESIAVISEGAPGIPETVEPTIPQVNPEVLVEDEIDEAIAPITINVEAEPSAISERSADNVKLTMESSKEDVPVVESFEPLKLEMNLEGEEDEPLGSRVTRKTNSPKLFRKKSKVATTTASPKKKTKANQQENTANSENSATRAESTIDDKSGKIARSVVEGTVTAKAGTLEAANPGTAFTDAENQAFNPTFATAANQTTAATAANQAIAPGFITSANRPLAAPFTGVVNQPSFAPITGATNQSPTVGFLNQPLTTTLTGATATGFINTANQPLTIAFTGATSQPGFINTAQQPLTTAFTGAINQPSIAGFASAANQPFAALNSNAQPTVDSVAKSYDSITIRTDKPGVKTADSATKNKDKLGAKAITPISSKFNTYRKDQDGIKPTDPVSNGANQSDSQAATAFTKKQSTAKAETAEAEKTPSDQTVNSSILNGTTTAKSEPAVKTVTPLQAKKLSPPSKINGPTKLEEQIKTRHARLTTRTEALAALRKENEKRRTKKMIEASMKLLESESARFSEYEKRRREQLDKLKDKLRAKREKMLYQYKDELIEAIHHGDEKQSNLRRRDLVDEDSRTDEQPGFVNYSPILEMRSLHDNDEYEESGKAKRSMLLDHSVKDEEEIYDTSAGELREAFKRSPMVVVGMNNKPQIMEGDSGEYYTPEQQRSLEHRVTEAQRRMYQQRQEQQASLHQHPGTQGQYPQIHYPYSPQNEYTYPPNMQQPYPPQRQQPYPSQRQQPYPPQVKQPYPPQVRPPYAATSQPEYMPRSHQQQQQQRHPMQHYQQNHRTDKNAAPLNVQYNHPPQVVPQQQTVLLQQSVPQQPPVYPLPPVSAQQPVVPPGVATQQQPDFKQQRLNPAIAQQQPIVQQPNTALHNQKSLETQQPGVDYYNQDPATMPQLFDSSYYNYAPTNTHLQESDIDYANQQAAVSPQQEQPEVDYYNHPPVEGQQYPYSPASINPDYYKQYYASQQQADVNNIKNAANTQLAAPGVIEQVAVPQTALNPQPAVPYQQTNVEVTYGQQPTPSSPTVDQNKQILATEQVPDSHLYEQQEVGNTENLQDLKVYQPAPVAEDSATPFDANSYNQYHQNSHQQQPQVNLYEISPTAYESIQQAQRRASRPYKKAKRSNFKVLEINPSIYEDDDSDYNLHELFMKPSSRFSSRNYRSTSNPTDNKRYRRGASTGEEEDGPLSISLGLDLSNMMPRENSPASSDGLSRRKRQAKDTVVSQTRSPVNKNIKKVYKSDNDDKHKKTPRRLTQLKRIDDADVVDIIPRVRKLRLVDHSINYLPSIKVFANNHLDDNKDMDTLLTRRRRSPDPIYEHGVSYNHINRNEDSDMNEIWNDIIEMKHDEALDEYDRSKDELFSDFLKDQKLDNLSIDDKKDSASQKVGETTTKANIESIIVEAIPKLENVITGGIEKAQNLTGNFEDFIDNFDEQFDETTANVEEISEYPEDINSGRLTHGVFKTVIGGVKKFFNFISGVTKIFHNH